MGGVLHAGTVRLDAENKARPMLLCQWAWRCRYRCQACGSSALQAGEHSPVVHVDVSADLQQLIVAYWDKAHQLNVAAVRGRGRGRAMRGS